MREVEQVLLSPSEPEPSKVQELFVSGVNSSFYLFLIISWALPHLTPFLGVHVPNMWPE